MSTEETEHERDAREFFEKWGYRPLTERQSKAITLIGNITTR